MAPNSTAPSRRGPRGVARHGRLPRRGPVRTLLAVTAGVLAVVLVSSVSVAAIAVRSATSGVQTVTLGNEGDVQDVSIGAIQGGANILLVGSDEREADSQVDSGVVEGVRNDVNILVHLSQDHTRVTAVSFPRDLMIDVPACTGDDGEPHEARSYQQFNTLYEEGGMNCTVTAVEQMTGLSIPYAGKITFDGVIEMSNALGGVDVCVSQPIRDTDSGLDLGAGVHTLQGADALAFLRTRHGVGDGSDLARISSQQVFLSSMMRKVISGGTLGNVGTLYKLASAALSNMTLSSSLSSPDSIVQLGLAMRDLRPEGIVFVQYPVVDDPYQSGRVVASEADAATLNGLLQTDADFTLGDDSEGRGATVDESTAPVETTAPESPATPEAPTDTATPEGGTGATSPATEPVPVTTLPSTVTGQTAAESTCSQGNSWG